MIYLNNASTSYPKPEIVINSAIEIIKKPHLSVGRSTMQGSENIIEDCRLLLSRLFNIDKPGNISFTSGATQSLNMVIRGLKLKAAHVITTAIEHSSVLRPLKLLEANGETELSIVQCDSNAVVNPDDIEKEIRGNTKAIIVNHASNVLGTVTNIRKISEIAHDENITLIVDASQSAGCVPIDVRSLGIDILVFTGHKSLFGLEGIGGVYIRDGLHIEPLIVGGTGIKSDFLYQSEERPAYYEAGTQNTVGIASLRGGVGYILEEGLSKLRETKERIYYKFIQGLEQNEDVVIYGNKVYNTPIISFNIRNLNPKDVGYMLANDFDIIVRAGFLCAPLIHKNINTYPEGTVRISFSHFTKEDELTAFLDAIKYIINKSKQSGGLRVGPKGLSCY